MSLLTPSNTPDAMQGSAPPHHHVPPCMSWSLLLSIFALVVLPATILAAEGTGGTPPPLPPPPPPQGGGAPPGGGGAPPMGGAPAPGGMGGGQMGGQQGQMPPGGMGQQGGMMGGQQGMQGQMPPGGMPGQGMMGGGGQLNGPGGMMGGQGQMGMGSMPGMGGQMGMPPGGQPGMGSMPGMMGGQMPPGGMPGQQSGMDPSAACLQGCDRMKTECATKTGSEATQCTKSATDCTAGCQRMGQGGQQGQMPPGGMGSMPGMMGGQQGMQGQMPPGGMPGQGMMGGQKGQMMPMGQPQQGQMPPGDQGQMPDQSAQMEEQMKKQQAMMLKGMQQGLAGFAGQLTRIEARIASLAKKGIKAPSELSDAITKAKDVLAKLKAAQTWEEAEALDVQNTMQEVGEVLQEQLPNLERLANLTQIYTRIESQIKTLERQLSTDKTLAKRSKIDLSEVIADFESDLNKLKAAYAENKAKIAVGDVEEGFDMLQQDVFDAMDAVSEHHAVIQQMSRLSSTIGQVDREIKQNQKQLDGLKKKKLDTKAAQAVLDTAKAKLVALKAAAAAKPVDVDAMTSVLQDLQDLRDQFIAEVNDLNGVVTASALDTGLQIPGFQLPDFGSILGSTAGSSAAPR